MKDEVQQLKTVGFIREVNYPRWVSNVVMVKKTPEKWRMCVDFTNLNKACPKDSFPLPRIDQLVDATAGFALLSFLDAYSGYNQISMDPADVEDTAFITDRGLYCYRVMPFGLKNAGATYQRLVNRMFAQLLGQSIEVYVDDMLVKSRTTDQHVDRLTEVFAILRQYRMRLNPAKCVFGVESGKFLGFMSTDRCLPFFKAIRGAHRHIDWTEECAEAFRKLKAHMGKAPVLSKPEVGETLGLYLSVSECAVSSVLTRDVEGS
ncbi:unnamed protein product, partial [Prunus brigantina]